MIIKSYRELEAYKAAFALQQDIFVASKQWPAEEKFALTDQVRRASRSIGANLAEAWAKRRYPAHFLSKVTDADGELQETVHWLDTAQACNYLKSEPHAGFAGRAESLGRQLGGIIAKHESFCIK
jgi:four helix bundle protein